MLISGQSPDGRCGDRGAAGTPLVLASQFHPELQSRPNRPHPLFLGFVRAAMQTGARSTGGRHAIPAAPGTTILAEA